MDHILPSSINIAGEPNAVNFQPTRIFTLLMIEIMTQYKNNGNHESNKENIYITEKVLGGGLCLIPPEVSP